MASKTDSTPAKSEDPPAPAPEDPILTKLNGLKLTDAQRTRVQACYTVYTRETDADTKAAYLARLRRIISLPWGVSSSESDDVAKAKEILDASHTGMEKVKKRIYDFMTVRRVNTRIIPPVLCIYGPSGIGKSSMAKSIAAAMGRKFAKVSLLDISKSAQGSHKQLGLILQAVRAAGTANPVILLEDVNHLVSPLELALIQAIDPDLRGAFVDSSIGVSFDLSQVFFIAAWSQGCSHRYMPGRLFPKVEFVFAHPEGYTVHEKLQIAKNHLLAKNMLTYSLSPDSLVFEESALETLIESYTREWGVVALNQKIDQVCRAVAVKRIQAEEDAKTIVVDEEFIEDLFGAGNKPYPIDHLKKRLPVGVSFVLYTAGAKGSVEIIELARNELKKGSKLKVTGLVSDVIKESCKLAFSYLYNNAAKYKLDQPAMNQGEIHVHLPRGATYKCGPSAGCAFMLTFFSFFSGRHIRADSVVTGEVTLTGRVTSIGGINRKAYAAYSQGFRRIVLPKENEKYVEDQMDATLKKEMEVVFVSTVDELFEQMMEREVPLPFAKL